MQASKVRNQRRRDAVLLGIGKLRSPRKGREGGAPTVTEHRGFQHVGCIAKHAEDQCRHYENLRSVGHIHNRKNCFQGRRCEAKFRDQPRCGPDTGGVKQLCQTQAF